MIFDVGLILGLVSVDRSVSLTVFELSELVGLARPGVYDNIGLPKISDLEEDNSI